MVSIWQTYKQHILLGIVVLFHAIGLVGLESSNRLTFLSLSPFNLILSISCLIASYSERSYKLFYTCLFIGAIGFLVELIGVHTGYLFGSYTYGATLGTKLFEIPVVIAINWIMLSLCAISFVVHFKTSVFIQAFFSAFLMTLLDLLIEPVAVKSDFWQWHGNQIPISNYITWFVVSYVLHFIVLKMKTVEQTSVSKGLFVVLCVFFGLLNCF